MDRRVASDELSSRGVDWYLTGYEEQLSDPERRRIGAGRIRRVWTGDDRFHAALVTLPERRQRVQTLIRRVPPPTIALTVCRLGSNRRALTLFAWLCWRPTTGVLPQISQCLAIWTSSLRYGTSKYSCWITLIVISVYPSDGFATAWVCAGQRLSSSKTGQASSGADKVSDHRRNRFDPSSV